MNLLIKTVTSDFEDINALERLNNEAFPAEERMEIDEMMQLISRQIIEVTAVTVYMFLVWYEDFFGDTKQAA